jgi:hypothetical protein
MNRLLLAIATLSIGTALTAAQGREVVWDLGTHVTEADQRDILRLAADIGIRTPRRVVDNRSPCPIVSVFGEPVVDGNRVTTTVAWVRPRKSPECRDLGFNFNIRRRGSWATERSRQNPRRNIAWRIRDAEWHRDIALGPDVTYEDAATIVLAIRHDTLVDMRKNAEIAKARDSDMNADQIFWISRYDDDSMKRLYPDIYADMFRVMSQDHEDYTGRGGSGHSLNVKIRNGRVELHGSSGWVS